MSENNSKFNIKYVNANICDVYYRLAEFLDIILRLEMKIVDFQFIYVDCRFLHFYENQ